MKRDKNVNICMEHGTYALVNNEQCALISYSEFATVLKLLSVFMVFGFLPALTWTYGKSV